MKKRDKLILVIYIIFGIVLIIMGATIQIDYYSSLMFAMGVALAGNSIMQFVRFYHNTRPENIELYNEKIRKQTIDLKDERKVQLRNRAGYITWAVTMVVLFLAIIIVVLFRADILIVYVLIGIVAVQYILVTIIYKYLCRKM